MVFRGVVISMNMPEPVKEYRFHPERKWRFDYCWPEHKVALEVEGGIYGHTKKDGTKSKTGAHSSITGILRDIEKYNAAAELGWKIFRVQPSDLLKVKTFDMLKRVLIK